MWIVEWMTTRPSRRVFLVAGLLAAVTSATASGQAPAPPPPPVPGSAEIVANRHAGIEIGAKGVKAIVVEAGRADNLMEGIANTTLAQGVAKSGVFSESAIGDTAEAAGKFAQRIREEFKVSDSKVSVIGSSGLPKASNRDALVKAVADATKLASMTFIVPTEEVRYTIMGLLSESDRAKALLADVGSGNTKGGFLKVADVVDFSIPYGSVTFENLVAADVVKDKVPIEKAAPGLRSSVLEPELAKQVEAHPELTERQIVILSGGAPFAMATLLKPGDSGKKQIDLTTKDIAAYADLVRKSPITSPDLEAAKGTPAEKEVKNVLDIFTPTNLIAGSEILTALASKLNLEGKTLRFDRTGIMALIRGKVLEQAEKDTPVKIAAKPEQPPVVPEPPVTPAPAPPVTPAPAPPAVPTPPVVPPVGPEETPAPKDLPSPPRIPSKSLPEASPPSVPT